MAAVMAPLDVVQAVLAQVDGYVVPANINSMRPVRDRRRQPGGRGSDCGSSRPRASRRSASPSATRSTPRSSRLPARRCARCSTASTCGRPTTPVISNVTGELHPDDPEGIKDLLERQIASPVQWVLGLETLYAQGCRAFVEVGPKRALKGFVDEVLGTRDGVISTLTCHPKTGEAATFNQALCSLWAGRLWASDRIAVGEVDEQEIGQNGPALAKRTTKRTGACGGWQHEAGGNGSNGHRAMAIAGGNGCQLRRASIRQRTWRRMASTCWRRR